MKKSEFYSAILEGQESLRELTEKLESDGYRFDPEEELLPEKLRLSSRASEDYAYIMDGDESAFYLCINHEAIAPYMQISKPSQRLVLAAEMIRRWNAWSELERLAAEAAPHAGYLVEKFTQRLHKILESGKP